ncbi:MAG: DUF2905 domain-containing protein [Hydrogenophilaceae bacterium]|nr:DUF2905 domain-containing protein [Hydrogenophilaceae bacterium]
MLKYLISLIVFLFVTGLLWPVLSRLGLGRLPGDATFVRHGRQYYFPFTSSLILSLAASLLFGFFW